MIDYELIDEEKTKEKHGYSIFDLKPNSCKIVICYCSICGIEREKKFRYASRQKKCLKCANKINANTNKEIKQQKLNNFYKIHGHPRIGKFHTLESKQKMSKSKTGQTHSEETKQKLSKIFSGENNPMYGKKHTEESLIKMCDIQSKIVRKGKDSNLYGIDHSRPLSYEQFVEKSNLKHNYRYNYSLSKYNKNTDKLIIICPMHGEFEQVAANHLAGNGCQFCNLSKAELQIKNYLDLKNINYIAQHRFSDCKNINTLPFDYYLLKYNLLIEYDGELHYKNVGSLNNNLERTQENDNIKTKYCEINNIKLIRIPYWEFKNIENILEREING